MNFIEISSNPIPKDAEVFAFDAPDGAPLRGAYFPAEDARASIALVTGWAEYTEKYFETIDRLRARKFNVAMMDWRGQGLSDRESPEKIKWRGYFDLISNDLRHFAEQHAMQRFNGPFFLMTHSMGGLPALMLLAKGYDQFTRALLCAPMTQLFPTPSNQITGLAAGLVAAAGFANTPVTRREDDSMRFEGNMFSSDERRHTRFRDLKLAEPKAANEAPTFGWLHAAAKASSEIHQAGYFDSLQIPVRIISAGKERRINGADHEVIAAKNDKIERVVIPGALHEIMMERDDIQDVYWRVVDDFFEPALSAS